MTKTLKTILYSILALVLAAIPATILAGPQGPGFGGPGSDRAHGFMSGRMLERFADHLDLSDSQREQIRAVLETYREDVEGLVDVMGVARGELQEQIRADAFDETAVREASGRVAAVSADLAVMRARIHGDVRQILTPEQLEKAKALRELFSDFAGDRREHRRGGFGRHFSGPETD